MVRRTMAIRAKLGSIEAAAVRSSGPRLWNRIFEFADAAARRLVPPVLLSLIRPRDPKITCAVTEWFARHVDEPYQCRRGKSY